MKSNDVIVIFIQFSKGTDGKTRPAVVIKKLDKTLVCFRITSKYKNKSSSIKKQYYPIQDWKLAGLKMESWIDIGATANIDLTNTSFKKIGTLTLTDIKGLKEFIINYYGYAKN